MLPILAMALALSGVKAATRDYTYEFNSVAITAGGFLTGFIAHPTEEHLLYVRSDIGSSYRWTQDLDRWVPLTDFISEADSNLLGTEAFALDPNDPEMLYLAQGRYTSSNNTAFFVSSDRGETFDIHPSPFLMGANELGRNNGERLAVNPFKSGELYFGSRTQGLWKSTDNAVTWSNVTQFPDAFANGIGFSFVMFDPTKEGTIYAAGTVPQGIYVSTDSGESWEQIPGQPDSWVGAPNLTDSTPPASDAPQPMRAVLSSAGVMFITYCDFPGPYACSYGNVWSYNTESQEWADITPNADNSVPPPYGNQSFPQGGYNGISVAHDDPNTLVVTSLDRDPGPAIDSLYISRDAGKSWTDVSQLTTPNVNASGGFWGHDIATAALADGTPVPWLNFDWSERWGGYGAPSPNYGQAKFGWWMSALLISPWNSQKVMYATGTTLWTTDNLLTSTEKYQSPDWYLKVQGIEETFCLTMTSPNDGAHLLTGLGDANGMAHFDLTKPQPMHDLPVFSNLNSIDWAGQKQDYVVRVGVNQLPEVEGICNLGAISGDYGITWKTFGSCIPPLNRTTIDGGTVAVDASGEHIVWSYGSNPLQGPNQPLNDSGPYYSTDEGVTWTSPVGLDISTPNITSDKVQAGTFYSYTDSVWYVSTDGGQTYTSTPAAELGLPEYSGSLPVVDTYQAGHVYLSLADQGIYKSYDFGSTWTKSSRDQVDARLFTLGAPPEGQSTPTFFIWGTVKTGGAVGLYRSDDEGSSWKRVNDDAHQYGGPTIIVGDPRVYGRVYFGTGGRGTLYADIVEGEQGTGVLPGTGGI